MPDAVASALSCSRRTQKERAPAMDRASPNGAAGSSPGGDESPAAGPGCADDRTGAGRPARGKGLRDDRATDHARVRLGAQPAAPNLGPDGEPAAVRSGHDVSG